MLLTIKSGLFEKKFDSFDHKKKLHDATKGKRRELSHIDVRWQLFWQLQLQLMKPCAVDVFAMRD
jgi:hypothetical protein